jgi:hypothetical protein
MDAVKDNAYINAKFEQDKLQLNGPKCHKLHIGKASKFCPVLKAHKENISNVSSEKYVGDVVSTDGKHTANVKSRRSKGIGVVNEILSILNHMGLGSLYFKAGMLLRSAMLHSVLLCNAETWLRLRACEVRMLERVDEMLIRKLLQVPRSTPGAALYLETGALPIQILLKVKRIMFLHHILTREKETLIHQVLMSQIEKPVKGDWFLVVLEDLETLGLKDFPMSKIAEMSKEALKQLVKKHAEITALSDLNARKSGLSKISSLAYNKLAFQSYLMARTTSKRQKRLQFRWRTRMVNVGWNYGDKRKCPLCNEADDTQEHVLLCQKINIDKPSYELNDISDLTFLKFVEKALRRREVLLENLEKDSSSNN